MPTKQELERQLACLHIELSSMEEELNLTNKANETLQDQLNELLDLKNIVEELEKENERLTTDRYVLEDLIDRNKYYNQPITRFDLQEALDLMPI